jgi:hypothetical protein
MDALLAGSLAAAFAAGLVAFFAPCCAGVMLPTYLAAVSGGSRFRVARLSALYVAGVSVVVLPITLGASALAYFVSDWHAQLFVLGGVMMLFVAVGLWRGSMLPVNVPKPAMTGGSVLLSAPSPGRRRTAVSRRGSPLRDDSGHRRQVASRRRVIAGLVAPLVPLALLAGRLRGRLPIPG